MSQETPSARARKPRILHVINSLSGSGGAEHGLVREITRFDRRISQLVVRLYAQDDLGHRVDSAGIGNVTLGLDPSHSGWNWVAGVARLRSLIRAFEPDVVHSSLFSANLVAQIATRGTRIPVLSTLTNSGDVKLMRSYQPGAASSSAAALRGLASWAARSDHIWFRALTFDALTTNCSSLGVSEERGIVIPRGVPVHHAPLEPIQRQTLGLPEDVPIILNVGRQTAQKGHQDLVVSVADLRRSYPVHLVVIGREGNGTGALRSSIEASGLYDHVTVIPYTDQVNAYLSEADVFAFPSLMEGLGTAVLEAMAARLPVVAYDIAPVREISGDGSLATLVPVGDRVAFTAALAGVLDGGHAVSHMVEAAYNNVVSRHSVDGVASRVQDRLEQIASSHRAPGSL